MVQFLGGTTQRIIQHPELPVKTTLPYSVQLAIYLKIVFIVRVIHRRTQRHPAQVLLDLELDTGVKHQVILRLQQAQGLEFIIDVQNVGLLQDNEVLPVILFTDREDGAARIQSIQEQADGQTRKAVLQMLRQTIEGFEFTVLFGGVFSRILDEFCHQREDKTGQRDQLGFQYRVIVEGTSMGGARHAMRTVSLREGEHTCAINGCQLVLVEQTVGIQYFAPDQALRHARDGFLHFSDNGTDKRIIERISVWTVLRPK